MASKSEPAKNPSEEEVHEDAVQEAADAQEKAEEKREKQAARAQARKTNPKDAGPPPQTGSEDERKYRVARLVNESRQFLGVPGHIVAGALHGVDREYLSLDETQKLIEDFQGRAPGEE